MTARIITISREFGSGGRTIGELVAKELGVAFYDKVLIDIVAKKSGFAIDYIKNTEEQVTPSFLFNLAANGYYTRTVFVNDGLPASDNLFILQSKIIREIAEKEPCVIVGRCADYILREFKDRLDVFVYAPLEDRVARAVKEYGVPEDVGEKTVRKNDKIRSRHYQYYAGEKWGDMRRYGLTLNSSAFGIEGSAAVIVDAAKKLLSKE